MVTHFLRFLFGFRLKFIHEFHRALIAHWIIIINNQKQKIIKDYKKMKFNRKNLVEK